MKHPLDHVAIVGAGLIGCSWAVVFARAGTTVTVFDADAATLARVPARVRETLADMERLGLADHIATVAARITIAPSLQAALAGAQYVQESVFETLEAKRTISHQIGALIGPDTVVGSSSSGIPASAFTQGAPNRGRFLIAHPVNPPHLIPVVELVPAPWTDPAIVPWLRARMADLGQTPVVLTREVQGFILNRLQGALLNEAWALYDEGYASAADIDTTVSKGLGLRWAFMGPFETIDLNAPGGIADYAQRLGPLYHDIARSRTDPTPWSPALTARLEAERRETLPADALPARARWRDMALMRLVRDLRSAATGG
ncbi:MAG: 3-hydroxyacyl-CoA dehydrogenase [Paracoccaceae bacterium]|jgi:L-gulonate 3-dehydrogenase